MSDEKKIPDVKVGDVIYVRGAMFMSHGVDDYVGGKATVSKVEQGMSAGKMVPFVSVREIPGCSMNWNMLAEEQDALRECFGNEWAYPDPDDRPEFNGW